MIFLSQVTDILMKAYDVFMKVSADAQIVLNVHILCLHICTGMHAVVSLLLHRRYTCTTLLYMVLLLNYRNDHQLIVNGMRLQTLRSFIDTLPYDLHATLMTYTCIVCQCPGIFKLLCLRRESYKHLHTIVPPGSWSTYANLPICFLPCF